MSILCAEKNISILNWENSSLKLDNFEFDTNNEDLHTNNYESQSKQFKQFLFKSSRYISDQIFATSSSSDNKNLLLVKELPNFAFYNVKQFHDLLREFCTYSKYSLVFMITKSSSSKSSNPAKLFTLDICKELNIQEIAFNSIANSYLYKHIERIARQEGLDYADKNYIDNLCNTCNGDLRSAINILELYSSKSNVKPNVSMPTIGKKENTRGASKKENSKPTGEAKKKKVLFENNNMDLNLSIFRSLGKILYRKSLQPNEEGYEDKLLAESKLPAHMKKFYREPMTCDPEDVYFKIPIASDTFMMYLYQNFIEIFSLKCSSRNFENNFKSLESISESFMLTDLLNCKLLINESNNNVSETKLKEISTLITMRSVLFNFNFDGGNNSEKSSENKSKSVWMPLYKPFTYKVREIQGKRAKQAEDIFGKNEAANPYYFTEINREFYTTFLPYITLISAKRRNYFKNLAVNESTLLFSKYKAVNSKTSVESDQALFKESNNDFIDTFDNNNETNEINVNNNNKKEEQTQMSMNIKKTNEKLVKNDYYESLETLSYIDEKLLF